MLTSTTMLTPAMTMMTANGNNNHHDELCLPPPCPRSRTPSWTAQRLDTMLNDLRDNIRRLSTTVVIPLESVNFSSASTKQQHQPQEQSPPPPMGKWTSSNQNPQHQQQDEDAKEAETLRLILEANHHHAQYAALMDQALPIIEKLKAAKDGGFFTSLCAIIKGASRKTDRVKHLMQRAEWEAEKMNRKWDRAEQLASSLHTGKYLDMLREARRKAAKQNARIDARMTELRRAE